ncbi:MAG: TIGR02301 family protein [Hyphomicrobiaceae bacterium]
MHASTFKHVSAGLMALHLTLLTPVAVLAQTPVAQAKAALPDRTDTPGALKPEDSKPYDAKLSRLSEILGAVHYLRELCGQNDHQLWRDRMRDILRADGGSALRRAMLTRSFNNGYRSYSRTYQSCTPTAQTAISHYLAEGAQIADDLAKNSR